jgi:hypothetical protein
MKTLSGNKLLTELIKTFKAECPNIREVYEGEIFSDYVIFIYSNLNCEDLEDIAKFIRKHFSNEGRYTHKLPTIGTQREYSRDIMAIRISQSLVEEKFGYSK